MKKYMLPDHVVNNIVVYLNRTLKYEGINEVHAISEIIRHLNTPLPEDSEETE